MARLNKGQRQLHHTSSSSVQIAEGFPNAREGNEGDITLRHIRGRGVYLFARFRNRWYSRQFLAGQGRDTGVKEASLESPGDGANLNFYNPQEAQYQTMDTSDIFNVNFDSKRVSLKPGTMDTLQIIEAGETITLSLTDSEYGAFNLVFTEGDLEISDGATFTVTNQNDEEDSDVTNANTANIAALEERMAALEASLAGATTTITQDGTSNIILNQSELSDNPAHTRVDNRTDFDVALRDKVALVQNNFRWFKDEMVGTINEKHNALINRLRPSNNPRYVTAEEFNALISDLSTIFDSLGVYEGVGHLSVDSNSIAASGSGDVSAEATFIVGSNGSDTTYQLDMPAGSTFTTASQPAVTNPSLVGYGLISQIMNGNYSISDTGLVTIVDPASSGFTAGQTVYIANYGYFNPSETQITETEADGLLAAQYILFPGTFSFSHSNDEWTFSEGAHGLVVGDMVKFANGMAEPNEYYTMKEYFVIDISGGVDKFKLSTSAGGSVIDGDADSPTPGYQAGSWKAYNIEEGKFAPYSSFYDQEGIYLDLVEGENYTSGGVCIIGGDVSHHTNRPACLQAGGTWHN